MDGITRQELVEAEKRLLDALRYGFEGINGRLDTLNGQTRRHGESIAAHEVRLAAIDESIDGIKEAALEATKGDKRGVSVWDVWLVLAAIGGTVGVLKFFGALS